MSEELKLPSELPEGFTYTDLTGLTEEQAEEARRNGFANRMTSRDEKTVGRILLEHIFTWFNLLNIALAVCLLLVGSYRNMLFVGVVVANTLIGALQEYRAQKTISSLKLLNAPSVHVLRDGEEKTLKPEETVRGDLHRDRRQRRGHGVAADRGKQRGA